MPLFPPTAARIASNTAADVNSRIRKAAQTRIEDIASRGNGAIQKRLLELDHEWDIERCMQTGASTLVLAGLILSLRKNHAWLLLPAGVAVFLLQHALRGWCPPLPMLRSWGIRTAEEINEERIALKTIRGDFYDVSVQSPATAAQAVQAVRR